MKVIRNFYFTPPWPIFTTVKYFHYILLITVSTLLLFKMVEEHFNFLALDGIEMAESSEESDANENDPDEEKWFNELDLNHDLLEFLFHSGQCSFSINNIVLSGPTSPPPELA